MEEQKYDNHNRVERQEHKDGIDPILDLGMSDNAYEKFTSSNSTRTTILGLAILFGIGGGIRYCSNVSTLKDKYQPKIEKIDMTGLKNQKKLIDTFSLPPMQSPEEIKDHMREEGGGHTSPEATERALQSDQ